MLSIYRLHGAVLQSLQLLKLLLEQDVAPA